MSRTLLDDLISQAEAARMRGVTRQSISDLVARGKLTPHLVAGRVLVSRTEVENFQQGPTGRPPGAKNVKKKARKS